MIKFSGLKKAEEFLGVTFSDSQIERLKEGFACRVGKDNIVVYDPAANIYLVK